MLTSPTPRPVIQARDPVTLEPFDYYYVLFDSRASAAAYSEAVFRLWKLNKARAVAAQSPSPQVLFPSQSIYSNAGGTEASRAEERAIRSFTLALPTQRHHLQLEEYPRTPNERWERMWGAAPNARSWAEALSDKLWPAHPPQWGSKPPSPWPSPEPHPNRPRPPSSRPAPRLRYLVLMGFNGGDSRTTPIALRQALEEDGESRNLPWRIQGLNEPDGGGSIVPLGRGLATPGMEKFTKPVAMAGEPHTQQDIKAQPSPAPEAPKTNGVMEDGQEDEKKGTGSDATVDNVTTSNITNLDIHSAESVTDIPAGLNITPTPATVVADGSKATHDTDSDKQNDMVIPPENEIGAEKEKGVEDEAGAGNSAAAESAAETEPKKPDENTRRGRFYDDGEDDGWKYRRYVQFIVAFEDEPEARRFVREWHARDVRLVRTEVLLRGAGRGKHRSAYTARPSSWEERREVTASLLW